jgi:hypothetical protein
MKTKLFPWILVLFAVAFCATSARAQSVSVSVAPATITDAGDETTFTLTISPPASVTLTINFVMTGTARLGDDYALIGDFNKNAQVVIPVGHTTATVTLHAFYNDRSTGHETAIFNLFAGSRYRVGSPSRAQVTIQNVP